MQSRVAASRESLNEIYLSVTHALHLVIRWNREGDCFGRILNPSLMNFERIYLATNWIRLVHVNGIRIIRVEIDLIPTPAAFPGLLIHPGENCRLMAVPYVRREPFNLDSPTSPTAGSRGCKKASQPRRTRNGRALFHSGKFPARSELASPRPPRKPERGRKF